MSAAHNTITVEQAYQAMLAFLEREVELTESSDLADLVSEYRLGEDGQPRDPTLWEEWLEAVGKVKQNRQA
jgi:hypothetical protein